MPRTERDIPDPMRPTTDAWLATLGTDSARVSPDAVLAALDGVRDEPEVGPGHLTGRR